MWLFDSCRGPGYVGGIGGTSLGRHRRVYGTGDDVLRRRGRRESERARIELALAVAEFFGSGIYEDLAVSGPRRLALEAADRVHRASLPDVTVTKTHDRRLVPTISERNAVPVEELLRYAPSRSVSMFLLDESCGLEDRPFL